jgi:hypothetical protein
VGVLQYRLRGGGGIITTRTTQSGLTEKSLWSAAPMPMLM